MAKIYRSASTGKFVSKATVARHPARTLTETRGGGSTGSARSAATGKFVTRSHARRHPGTTVTES